MKNYNTLLWLLLLGMIFFFVTYSFINNNRRFKRLENQLAIEAAKANFGRDTLGILFDSVYVKYDTVFFYKDGIFKGKSVTIKSEY